MSRQARTYPGLTAFLGVLLLVLAACSPRGGSPAAPAGQPGAQAPRTPSEKLAALNQLPADERRAKLLEEAKKEGTVVWYSTIVAVEAEPFIASFNQEYPDIKVQYVRANADELLEKLTSEYRAGKHLVDAISIGQETFPELKRAGVVGRYCSPERAALTDQLKDKDCEWTVRYYNPKVIGINTNRVPREQAPRTWNDLLDPRWQGRLGIPADDGPEWIVAMENMLGKERGQEYVRKMAEQRVQLHRSNTALSQLIAAGDVDAGFWINVPAITNTQKQGGPVASVSPDPLPATLTSMMIARDAEHPFAAALLIDYTLAREGQQRMAEISTRFGPRTDMTYPDQQVLEGVKLFPLLPEMTESDTYRQAGRQFKELFSQR